LDPFVGSGTTVLAAEQAGVKGIGFEYHPFVVRIASIKILWDTDLIQFTNFAFNILEEAKKLSKPLDEYPELVNRCYDENNLKAKIWVNLRKTA
jgi:hypothetical protein